MDPVINVIMQFLINYVTTVLQKAVRDNGSLLFY